MDKDFRELLSFFDHYRNEAGSSQSPIAKLKPEDATMAIRVELSPYLEHFVSKAVESGRYQDAEQVLVSALEHLDKQERKLEALRVVVEEGFNSGYAEDGVIERVIERTRQRSAQAQTT